MLQFLIEHCNKRHNVLDGGQGRPPVVVPSVLNRERSVVECDENFEKARGAFRMAADATCIVAMRDFAAAGLRFLKRADALSAIVDIAPEQKHIPSLFED